METDREFSNALMKQWSNPGGRGELKVSGRNGTVIAMSLSQHLTEFL